MMAACLVEEGRGKDGRGGRISKHVCICIWSYIRGVELREK